MRGWIEVHLGLAHDEPRTQASESNLQVGKGSRPRFLLRPIFAQMFHTLVSALPPYVGGLPPERSAISFGQRPSLGFARITRGAVEPRPTFGDKAERSH
jgi:hypothetical protein